jgi:hypothetical protein
MDNRTEKVTVRSLEFERENYFTLLGVKINKEESSSEKKQGIG